MPVIRYSLSPQELKVWKGARAIVKGEVEVVEVKTGKGFLPPSQIESYTNIVKKGYRLRYFQVDIVSFERNQFEIREELVTTETKLRHLRTI